MLLQSKWKFLCCYI